MRLTQLACALSLALAASVGVAAGATPATLNGTGSTVAAQLVGDWSLGFQGKTGDTVSYHAAGSADGITQVSDGQVDFAVSDVPMTASQAAGCASGQCVEIPWMVTATGIGYSLPGIHGGLHLTGKILGGIYLGKITNWDAPAIAAINKKLKLPNLKITPVWQNQPSGDTYAFTNYLEDVDPAVKRVLGPYSSVAPWPVGVGAPDSAGVVAGISKTSGAIGYANSAYLTAATVSIAAIRNTAGNFEAPTLRTIPAAAARPQKITPSGLQIVDPPKTERAAYPIASFIYAIVPAKPAQPTPLKSFLTYCVTIGQDAGLSAGFAALPAATVRTDRALISNLG
jgi:phosphate transport system substrate-binding protein